jgi:hypothetical protein
VPATRSLELAVNEHREVAISLEAAAPEPAPVSEAPAAPASAPVVEEQPAPKEPARVASSAPSRPAARAERPAATIQRDATAGRKRRTKTIMGYSSLGAGAACVAAAGVLYVVGALQGNEAHEAYQAAVVPAEIEGHWQDVKSASTKLLVGHVLAGVGVAAVGFGVYQLLTRPSARGGSARRGPALNLAVTRDTTSVVVSGRF